MTASSTPDLAARILAAIDELENAAREAKYGGEWWSTRHDEMPLVMADVAAVDDEGELREYVATDVERSTAVHIALHDPETVLRRCAADRKLLELVRRGITGHPGWCVNYEGQDPADYMSYDTCERHIEWSKTAIVIPELRELILRNLAEGYGITEEANA